MRLTAGLCPDPLGELLRTPGRYKGEGRKGKERVGNREAEGREGRQGVRTDGKGGRVCKGERV